MYGAVPPVAVTVILPFVSGQGSTLTTAVVNEIVGQQVLERLSAGGVPVQPVGLDVYVLA